MRKVHLQRRPSRQQLHFQRLLTGQRKQLAQLLREHLYPELYYLLQQAELDRGGVRLDAARGELADIFARINALFGRTFPPPSTEAELLLITTDLDGWQKQEHEKQLESLGAVAVIAPEPWKQTLIQGFVQDNLKLVKSLHGSTLESLETIVSGGLRKGLRVENIRKEIQTKLKVTKSKAALLARDQVGKLMGELVEHRQRAVGIKTYKWSTSKDEKVRDSHKGLEGTIQKWSRPPIVDAKRGRRAHPGQDYQCRCNALPVLPPHLLA